MKKLLLMTLGAATLSSCAMMMGTPMSYQFGPQTTAPVGVTASGTASVTKDAMNTMTTVKLTGLAANTYYVGHYHLQGTADAAPCLSKGAPIMASKMVGQSDATGMLTLSGSVMTSAIADATYINVHTASDAEGTPADDGVACTAIK
ncbi:superoxide dismutase [Deinococcus sonorensis]|uniref:Superoxide dismutase n=2 Tax=Deinococcus sonorensis TaxID=309891 RepID=A0AAU7U864_9DEIO